MAAAFTALRVLLGLFFFLTGALKLSDWLSADLHRHMVSAHGLGVRRAEPGAMSRESFGVRAPGERNRLG